MKDLLKLFFCIFSIPLIILILLIVAFKISVGKTYTKAEVIHLYQTNKSDFNKSYNEIISCDCESLYFDLKNNKLCIKTDYEICRKLDDNDNKMYKQTINLMKKLKINEIKFYDGNVEFAFFLTFGQRIIVKTNDVDKLMNQYHKEDFNQLDDDWYYYFWSR